MSPKQIQKIKIIKNSDKKLAAENYFSIYLSYAKSRVFFFDIKSAKSKVYDELFFNILLIAKHSCNHAKKGEIHSNFKTTRSWNPINLC